MTKKYEDVSWEEIIKEFNAPDDIDIKKLRELYEKSSDKRHEIPYKYWLERVVFMTCKFCLGSLFIKKYNGHSFWYCDCVSNGKLDGRVNAEEAVTGDKFDEIKFTEKVKYGCQECPCVIHGEVNFEATYCPECAGLLYKVEIIICDHCKNQFTINGNEKFFSINCPDCNSVIHRKETQDD